MSTAVIVGASRGLGRGLALEHRRRGWNVLGTVRDDGAIADDITTETVDVTDLAEVDALRDRLPGNVERLFVVAGIAGPMKPIGLVDQDEFADVMRTNVLGPLHVVDRLADRVGDRGTIAVMSSSQGSIALNDHGDQETYRISKAALNMGLRSVAARRTDGRTWLAVNPGYVRTDMTGDDADLSIDESVVHVVDVLDAQAGAGGMRFLDQDGAEIPW